MCVYASNLLLTQRPLCGLLFHAGAEQEGARALSNIPFHPGATIIRQRNLISAVVHIRCCAVCPNKNRFAVYRYDRCTALLMEGRAVRILGLHIFLQLLHVKHGRESELRPAIIGTNIIPNLHFVLPCKLALTACVFIAYVNTGALTICVYHSDSAKHNIVLIGIACPVRGRPRAPHR